MKTKLILFLLLIRSGGDVEGDLKDITPQLNFQYEII